VKASSCFFVDTPFEIINMILRTDFAAIDAEIIKAIDDTLNDLRAANQNDYALFLADGEYRKEYDNGTAQFNPNVIDYRMDRYKDSSRLKFLSEFLSTFYSFPSTQTSTDDSEQRLHMELMVYSHIWEAKPFLKKLYRLAHLNEGKQYAWDVQIPDMSKHDFIRNDIRKTFGDKGNNLFQIIKNGFHTSLRNAFAHAEYFFDTMNSNKRIILDNYGGEAWELQEISFDEWSKRFVYSALLSYHLLSLTHKHRTELIDTTGTDLFQIKQPSKANGFNFVWIKYTKEHDRFNFEKK
jgi:hypothetical protein